MQSLGLQSEGDIMFPPGAYERRQETLKEARMRRSQGRATQMDIDLISLADERGD